MSFLVYYYYCCYLGVVTWGKKTKNKKPNKKKYQCSMLTREFIYGLRDSNEQGPTFSKPKTNRASSMRTDLPLTINLQV